MPVAKQAEAKYDRSMRVLLTLICLAPLFAQQPPPPGGARPPRPAPKNLKILEPTNLMAVMHSFENALGVQCEHCHVKGNFASDEKPQKETARKMIVMAREINAKYFTHESGAEPAAASANAGDHAGANAGANAANHAKMYVTCFTCHHGAVEPMTAPAAGTKPAAAPGGPPPPAEK